MLVNVPGAPKSYSERIARTSPEALAEPDDSQRLWRLNRDRVPQELGDRMFRWNGRAWTPLPREGTPEWRLYVACFGVVTGAKRVYEVPRREPEVGAVVRLCGTSLERRKTVSERDIVLLKEKFR